MSQQSLFGFAPAEPTDRLFLALFPDQATATRIAALAADVGKRHRLDSRPHQTDRLHITLVHIGDWVGLPGDVVENTLAAAARVRAAAVDVAMDEVASFSNRRSKLPVVLKSSQRNEALHALRAGIGRELAAVGLGRCLTGSFEPHVTLTYAAQNVAAEAVEPIAWTAHEFVLIHSLLGQTRHIPLGRWPLSTG
ncbi:2'-5' RNA ligase [Tahibacter aquaticus]|uniref:2'-5' RNA ligase n=1 Tax=Tahibacter aquaticus TaxID=520092 RepID=A0A4R6YQC1_9GAMM|nr:2'-5' RNA ligase family protein [Tahibacter aquaticus]TDR40026.1 2'-5' RNA ligase [Tahibacter aquaticus]